MSIYLDNAATTKVSPAAADAAYAAMTQSYGNPSSTHRMGREAKKLLEHSRSQVAKALGCNGEELFFTSCGSEGDNWAIIRGAEYASRHGKHIISSMAEHSAVLKPLAYLESRGFEVTYLPPAPDGGIRTEDVLSVLRPDTCLVTLMMVNNETGGITDIASIVSAVKERTPHALIHTDAVQAFMKLPFSAEKLKADMVTISGHKIHAPKGVGALYIRRGLNLPPYILGGLQEGSRRAGTEALPQIAAFGTAAEEARLSFASDSLHLSQLRSHAVERLTAENPGLMVIGGGADHILSLSLPGYRSEVIMNYLESRDIFVSKSSACKKGGRSHVLEAMKLKSNVIDGAIRVSFSRFTTMEEVDILCDELRFARESLRAAVRR